TVHFLYSLCRSIATTTAAAVQLLVESSHHQGIKDDYFAALFGVSMENAYLRTIRAKPDNMARQAFFDRARNWAAQAMFQIDLRPSVGLKASVREVAPGTQAKERLDWRWFYLERQTIGNYLRNENTRLVWVDELPDSDAPYGKCVRPSPFEDSVIELSYTGC